MSKFESKQKRLERANKRREAEEQRRIKALYKEVTEGVLDDVASIFERLEVGGKLTYEEMAKFKRLDRLMQGITLRINGLTKRRRNELLKYLAESYSYSYEYMAYSIETTALARLNYTAITAEQIQKATSNPVTGLTLTQTLEKNRSEIIYKVQQVVTRSLVEGATYGQMAKVLKETFDGDYKKSIRVARTEAHRIVESGKYEAVTHASRQGVVMTKKWNNLGDIRVRSKIGANHVVMQGQTRPVDEPFDLGGVQADVPGSSGVARHDIHCRCFTTYEVQEIQRKTHSDLADLTFEDWQKERLK